MRIELDGITGRYSSVDSVKNEPVSILVQKVSREYGNNSSLGTRIHFDTSYIETLRWSCLENGSIE